MKSRYSANDPEISRILADCRKVYLISRWIQYGYTSLPFSGEYESSEPLVWMFNDHNGAYDEWVLTPISKTTTGQVRSWTFDEEEAKRMVDYLNEGRVNL